MTSALKQKNDVLFELISSLSKSEKKQFKMYVSRNFIDKELNSIKLFDLLDKMTFYDSEKVQLYFQNISKSALSNLRTSLYEQILTSLKLTKRNNKEIKGRELINFSKLLYERGLYQQSLFNLNKAKDIAKKLDDKNLIFSVISLEKQIELLHNTNSHSNRAQELINEQNTQIKYLLEENKWSNLSLAMYDFYLKFGHIKNQEQLNEFEQHFSGVHSKDEPSDFLGKIHKRMSRAWYYFISQNFLLYYKNSLEWINLFQDNEEKIAVHPILYLKGLHNTLSALFYCNKPRQFEQVFTTFKNHIELNDTTFNFSAKNLSDIYRFTNQLNLIFLKGEFSQAYSKIESFNIQLEEIRPNLNIHRYLLLQYKLACLCFGANEYKSAIKYLNNIINQDTTYLRQDIQCFGRILRLIAYFEEGEDGYLEYEIKNVYRFLIKLNDVHEIQKIIIQFLRTAIYKERKDLNDSFKGLLNEINQIQFSQFETRPLLYLDLQGWLMGKVNASSTEEEIQKRQKVR